MLLPGERKRKYDLVRVNRFGMRERDYALPKPAGTVRVVLLGDSYVFGWRVAAGERVGVHLERFLAGRTAGQAVPIEVLHLGVISWGLVSECAFLRRQLDQLQPDLVVQITVTNDLDDPQGVRGFGGMSSFSPLDGHRADSLVFLDHPKQVLGIDVGSNLLATGWGHESRTRFEQARQSVGGLIEDLRRLSNRPRYLLVVHWNLSNPAFHEHLGRYLDDGALLYLPGDFWRNPSIRIEAGDFHWNPAGHETMARVLYGVIRERGLLPELELEPWPEAEESAREFAGAGRQEAMHEGDLHREPRWPPKSGQSWPPENRPVVRVCPGR